MKIRRFYSAQRCIIFVLCLVFLQGTNSSDKVRRKRVIFPPDECSDTPLMCHPDALFRTMDGSCNNLANNTSWGKSFRIQNRLLPNAYDDGMGSPRSEGCNGELPGVRNISNKINAAGETQDLDFIRPQFIMTYGQFLAHDLVRTPVYEQDNGDDLECCDANIDHPECRKIIIPDDDKRFPHGGCMSFSRSIGHMCQGVREQMNAQSPYIDLSMTYGPTKNMSDGLRTGMGGKLKSINPGDYLPVDENPKKCELKGMALPDPPRLYCTKSGDPRAHETPLLASLHTIPHREHNRLAEALAQENPSWNDEMLFQTARKINIAEYQHTVYNEYLEATIGREIMEKYGIDVKPSGSFDTYDPTVDATVFNAFSTAAFRFGHSLIPQALPLTNFDFSRKQKAEELKHNFFKADLYHEHNKLAVEYLLMGSVNFPSLKFDRKFESSIRDDLFFDANKIGVNAFDLPALNIERGRDHGLPGYNAYRKYCGLQNATAFTGIGGLPDHLPDVAALLGEVYDCVDDIDLFIGLVTEKPAKGSQVGPTTQCLLAEQFKRLKDGDRFFYDRQGPGIAHAFSAGLLISYDPWRNWCNAFQFYPSTLGLPAVSPKTLKRRERAIGPVIELVAKKSCMDFSKQERNLTSNEISEIGDHDTQLTFDQALAFLKNDCEENENHSDDGQEQLAEIKNIRMSTLFCLNTNATQIQGNMFLRMNRANGQRGSCFREHFSDLEMCEGMAGVNITLWKGPCLLCDAG